MSTAESKIQGTKAQRTILVTGGSRGIGAAVCRRLAQDGFDIWLNFRSSPKEAEQVKNDVEAAGRQCRLVQFDCSNLHETRGALEPLLEEETPFGVVHNAGITRDGLFAMMSQKEWNQVLEVSLGGLYNVVQPVVKAMIRQRRGRIAVISSVSGQAGQAGQVNYSAAKAGLIGAVKALAREVARRNILVNAVAPGLIETDMTSGVPLERVLPLIPLGRVGSPEEVAGAVSFLMGPDASYITGQVIGVNGGLYM